MLDEKIIETVSRPARESKRSLRSFMITGGLLIVVGLFTLSGKNTNLGCHHSLDIQGTESHDICPIFDPIKPSSYIQGESIVSKIINDEVFLNKSAEKLSGAVQIDTTVYDNIPDVPEAPEVWIQFGKFHDYLKSTFPTVFDKLEFETVNTYGILLTWKGSDKDLKPLLLMAHQDVVPVQKDTIGDWTYSPFSGHFDGKRLFGRGSSDCKNLLIGLLETVELLIEQDFDPKRGLILSFGFDEEVSGYHGASSLARYLEEKLGRDSLYAVLDEGPGLVEYNGQLFAIPANSEKGYIDIVVELTTPGGHSSVPPDHTNIGIMSDVVIAIETDQYEPQLTTKNPILQLLQCVALNTKLDPKIKKSILRAGYDKVANSRVIQYISKSPALKYLIKTSQAIDIIQGGAKSNALPEHTSLIVNHRIAVESTVNDIKEKFLQRVLKVAKKFNLGVTSFDDEILSSTENGNFEISSYSGSWLEPSPISPTEGKVWEYLAGTTRHVFEDVVFPNISYPVILAPSLMPANTDTRHYWNLSKNIYRYTPSVSDMIANKIHSVDESVDMAGHLQLIAFFYEYIQNIDTAEAGL